MTGVDAIGIVGVIAMLCGFFGHERGMSRTWIIFWVTLATLSLIALATIKYT